MFFDPQKFNNQSNFLILINVIKHICSNINTKYQVRYSSYFLHDVTILVPPPPSQFSDFLMHFAHEPIHDVDNQHK